ncbi:hypothetical protein PsorP6_015255 [Peronosclerospora sorghi]|uniref:Uncharacterized protein n=1 Tax=Peronosclerospora sorghi TaxID=230839 RepID=A0ACC0VRV0_9STRA|nr:hypothetical protein PsorP6_015255 [Peronosclerospora sorghi]
MEETVPVDVILDIAFGKEILLRSSTSYVLAVTSFALMQIVLACLASSFKSLTLIDDVKRQRLDSSCASNVPL